MTKRENIYEGVKGFLTEVIGEEFIEEYDLGEASTLTGDLEMESIEIVELAEKVKSAFGQAAEMSEWMARLSLEQLIKLTIGDIVEFVDNAINSD